MIEFINKITKYFRNCNISIENIENELFREAKEYTAKMASAYLEQIDEALLANKKGRKETRFAGAEKVSCR